LPPYSRFVKGIEQFLDGAITSALQTLRHAALDSSNRQLQRFSLYWAAKLNNTVGNYEHAENLFEQAVEHAPKDSVECYELERAHLETEFFRIADASKAERPEQRFEQVKTTLAKLELVACKLDEKVHDYFPQPI
jgi:tetratricopeptide (TPR) repeat protein